MNYDEAAKIMISGSDSIKDSRVKKLDAAPSLWNFEISDGWEVRVKIASDVDNMQFFQFGSNHGGIVNYITQWSIYYCVYLNDDFKYASCYTNFWRKHHENYQNADIPDLLYFIDEYSDFAVTSGNMTITGDSSNFLTLEINGSYVREYTPYSWTVDYERVKGETEVSSGIFSHSKNDFGGSQYNGSYIINGGAEEFKNAAWGLYTVCRRIARVKDKAGET